MWNKTEIKLKWNKICFRFVSELFQAHYHIYSHVKKYANAKTVLANQRQQW